ncbi:MAG: hypothetical protein U0790_04130 [Isosphaeraceae bacterium]
MITVRLSDEYEAKFVQLARRAGMSPGPLARRILMAYIESQGDEKTLEAKLDSIGRHIPALARMILRLETKVDAFLENAEIVVDR